ncbi:hypothetical protein BS17DRAFT_779995 [Gyrodon lividus]|nr:hypothetical protein BS17DRAFT_779995 [Gyrodon lividus]
MSQLALEESRRDWATLRAATTPVFTGGYIIGEPAYYGMVTYFAPLDLLSKAKC